MNDMRKILDEFLDNSSPEQLSAELTKGNRPFFQTLEDPVLICDDEQSLPTHIPAHVSFFRGMFCEETVAVSVPDDFLRTSLASVSVNGDLALAA